MPSQFSAVYRPDPLWRPSRLHADSGRRRRRSGGVGAHRPDRGERGLQGVAVVVEGRRPHALVVGLNQRLGLAHHVADAGGPVDLRVRAVAGHLVRGPLAGRRPPLARGECVAREVACHCADSEGGRTSWPWTAWCASPSLAGSGLRRERVGDGASLHGHPLDPRSAAVRRCAPRHHRSPSPPAGVRVEQSEGQPQRIGAAPASTPSTWKSRAQSRPTWPRGKRRAALAEGTDDRVPGAEILLHKE